MTTGKTTGNKGRSGRDGSRGRGIRKATTASKIKTAPTGRVGEDFFKAYGVDTEASNATKRGTDERSPLEGGAKKKPSFFDSHRTGSTTAEKTPHKETSNDEAAKEGQNRTTTTVAKQEEETPDTTEERQRKAAREALIRMKAEERKAKAKAIEEEEIRKAELRRKQRQLDDDSEEYWKAQVAKFDESDEDSDDDADYIVNTDEDTNYSRTPTPNDSDSQMAMDSDIEIINMKATTKTEGQLETKETLEKQDDGATMQGGSISAKHEQEDNKEDDLFDEIGPITLTTADDDNTVAQMHGSTSGDEQPATGLEMEMMETGNTQTETTGSIPKTTTGSASQNENDSKNKHHKQQAQQPAYAPKTPLKYKAVNANSKNRRQCIRTNQLQGEKTPEATNRTNYIHKYNTRLTWKMNVPASDDPISKVKEITQEYLRELSQIDDKVLILNWYENGTSPPIAPNAPLPTTVTGTHKYLHKLFVPKPGKDSVIYPQVHLGHDVDFHTLRDELSNWTQNFGHGMFYNMLQAEDGTDIGWLLYSTRDMDAGALADELSDTIGVNVGLRYKGINTGTRNINPQNIVRALIVEASAQQKWQVQSALLQLYSRKMKDVHEYPNGIRLRFVKMKNSGVNKVEKSKMDKLRQRQKDFLDTITSHSSHEIVQIDYSASAGEEPTLRQMIMGLRSKDSGYPLFHCIDMDWKKEGFIFQFSANLAEEAETTILTLLPTLEHFYPDVDVRSNFTRQGIERCENMAWDDNRQMIIDTAAPLETEDIDEEENLLGFEFSAQAEEDLRRNEAPRFGPHGDDSISTLKSKDATTRSTWHQPTNSSTTSQTNITGTSARASSQSIQDDNASIISSSTTVTMESIQYLENKISGLSAQLAQEQQRNSTQFNAILHAIGQLNNSRKNDQSSMNNNNTTTGDDNNASGARS